jgi:hypothetical protein
VVPTGAALGRLCRAGIVHATGRAVLQVAREFVGDSDCDPAAVTAKGCSQPLLLPPRIEMSAMSEALRVTAARGFAAANPHSAAVVQVEVLACVKPVKVPAAINTWGSW